MIGATGSEISETLLSDSDDHPKSAQTARSEVAKLPVGGRSDKGYGVMDCTVPNVS